MKSVLVIILCATGNIIVGRLFGPFPNIPLFMDTILTVAAALYGGILSGVLAGLLTNLGSATVNALLSSGTGLQVAYCMCSMSTAIVVCLFTRDQRTDELGIRDLLLLSVLVCFVNSVLGGIIATFIYHDLELVPVDYIFVGMLLQDIPPAVAAIVARIPVNLVDKLIAVVAGYAVVRGVEAIDTRVAH